MTWRVDRVECRSNLLSALYLRDPTTPSRIMRSETISIHNLASALPLLSLYPYAPTLFRRPSAWRQYTAESRSSKIKRSITVTRPDEHNLGNELKIIQHFRRFRPSPALEVEEHLYTSIGPGLPTLNAERLIFFCQKWPENAENITSQCSHCRNLTRNSTILDACALSCTRELLVSLRCVIKDTKNNC